MAVSPPHGGTTAAMAGSVSIATSSAARCSLGADTTRSSAMHSPTTTSKPRSRREAMDASIRGRIRLADAAGGRGHPDPGAGRQRGGEAGQPVMAQAVSPVEDLANAFQAGPHLGVRRRQRRQADPQAVRVAVVGDDVPLPERGGDLAHQRVVERHVAAAQVGVARRGQLDTERGEHLVGDLDGVRRQADRLRPDRVQPGLGDQREHVLERQHPDDRGRAAEEAPDAGRPARRTGPSGTGPRRRASPGSAG